MSIIIIIIIIITLLKRQTMIACIKPLSKDTKVSKHTIYIYIYIYMLSCVIVHSVIC